MVTGINAGFTPAPALIDEYFSISAEGVRVLLSKLAETDSYYDKVHMSISVLHTPTMLSVELAAL